MPRPRLAICLLRTVAVAVVVVDVVRIVPTMERTCNSQKQLGWQLKQAPPLPRLLPLPSLPACLLPAVFGTEMFKAASPDTFQNY